MLEKWIETINDWPDLVALISEKGQLVSCSRAFTDWSGWTVRSLSGKHVHDELCAPARAFVHDRESCPLCVTQAAKEPETESTIVAANDSQQAAPQAAGSDTNPSSNPDSKSVEAHLEGLIVNERGSYLSAELFCRTIDLEGHRYTLVRFVDDSKLKHTFYELHRMSYFVDKSPFPLAEFSASGLLEFSNAAMTELMTDIGYDDEGQLLLLPQNFEQLLSQVIENKSVVDDVEVSAPDGSVWSWFFYHLIADGEDRVHGIATNITERIRREAIEKELEDTAAKMREDARKQEIAKLTHEFRSPLNSLVGFAGILKTKLKGRIDQQEQTFLDLIEQGGMKLADQISATLNAARDDLNENTLAVSKFGSQALCDELIAQISPLAAKKFLQLHCECEDLTLETDRAKLAQILVNFLDNAIKYTQQGSVTLIGKPFDGGYEFSVIDTGRGLTDDEQIDVFKDFHRTSGVEDIQGTGLGLSVVQELAKRLQSEVAVESVMGQGSRFYLRIPV